MTVVTMLMMGGVVCYKKFHFSQSARCCRHGGRRKTKSTEQKEHLYHYREKHGYYRTAGILLQLIPLLRLRTMLHFHFCVYEKNYCFLDFPFLEKILNKTCKQTSVSNVDHNLVVYIRELTGSDTSR